jgi:hypothetical protein
MGEALSGSCENHRRALRHVNGNIPFYQPPLKVAEVRLQVADEQRRLVGRGDDGSVVRVEGQLNVV